MQKVVGLEKRLYLLGIVISTAPYVVEELAARCVPPFFGDQKFCCKELLLLFKQKSRMVVGKLPQISGPKWSPAAAVEWRKK